MTDEERDPESFKEEEEEFTCEDLSDQIKGRTE